jgi:hypothetical protein
VWVRVGRCLVLTVASISLAAACTGRSHRFLGDTTTPQPPKGTIVGRMYSTSAKTGAVAGMVGEITIRAKGSTFVVARPVPDSRGYFRVSLAPGPYQIVGMDPNGSPPLVMRTTVVVRAWTTVSTRLEFIG